MSHVIVVGCGNIGSQLIPHLGRLPGIDRVTLIDGQCYEEKNITGQAIDVSDIGKPKSRAQAQRLHRIRPCLAVEAIMDQFENLPHGRLRCDLVLSGLDTKLARMNLGQSLWRLGGIPWIDAGVAPANLLVRISAYLPGEDSPCHECSWSDQDYGALEAEYPCGAAAEPPKPTNSSSGLGALAASLQMIAAQKCLAGQPELVPFGSQMVIEAMHHKQYLTLFRRNPRCRFDHQVWNIKRLAIDRRRLSLGGAMRLHPDRGSADESWLRVEGKPFAKRLACANCGNAKHVIRLRESLTRKDKACVFCGHSLLTSGWDLTETLTNHLPAKILSRSLASLGLREGEIFSIGNSKSEHHFEITVTGRDRESSGED
jgi:molybdopterin/thiamine biosynthesis adenylyltransferase